MASIKFQGKSKIQNQSKFVVVNSLTPTYALQRSVTSIEGGSEITFTVNTANVADGTSLPYTITGISQEDVVSGSLTGSFAVASNTASTTLEVSLEPTSPGVSSAALALNNGAASISVFPAPTYSLSRSAASVNEGSSITFTLTTAGVANGTSVPYTISGISAGDLSSGSLTGNFVVNNGSATITLTAASDALTDGAETISITAGGQTSSVTLNDTSTTPSPTYTLSRSAASINEGSSVTFTLTTTNVANGTNIPYSVTGISAGDLSSGSLSGNFVINNGSATVTLTAASDDLTEGTETITITAASQTSSTAINDTSYAVMGPAETVLLLAGDGVNGANNSGFSDGSSNNFAITRTGNVSASNLSPFGAGVGTSAYFDGSSYLTVPQSVFPLTDSAWTMEFWFNSNNLNSPNAICSADDLMAIAIDGASVSLSWRDTVSGSWGWGGFVSPFAFQTNTWYHIAVIRNGTSWLLFINGNQATFTINYPARNAAFGGMGRTDVLYIGAVDQFPFGNSIDYYMKGHLSNFAITKDAAKYTSNFTPSTAPLTNISGTSLLLNTAAIGIVDSTNKNPVITTFGNAAISTSVKKYGTGSMYFDGSSRVEMPVSNTFTYRTHPFTFEAWIYPTSIPIECVVYAQAPYGNNYFMVSLTTAGKISFWSNSVSSGVFTSNASVPLSAWTHIAVVREGTGTNQTKLYLNGTLDVSGTCAFDYANQANEGFNPVIGSYKHDPTNHSFRGYIDDLRITKNLARYTTNFTPPTGPLTIDV
jgi:hypothetical protein